MGEIAQDVAYFIIYGLPCGGFSARALVGYEGSLRPFLHSIYSDDKVGEFAKFIRDNTLELFINTDLSLWQGIDNPDSDPHIATMLRLSHCEQVWRKELEGCPVPK